MVKVGVISRSDADYCAQTKSDRVKTFKNADPALHPFERAREYTRALNATKLDKVFAKPFVTAFDGHRDSIWRMKTCPSRLSHLVTSSCDGEIRCWNIAQNLQRWRVKAHQGYVRGLAIQDSRQRVISCGDDKAIRIWNLDPDVESVTAGRDTVESGVLQGDQKPIKTFLSSDVMTDMDYSREPNSDSFATSGSQVSLWNVKRAEPIHSFAWGAETVNNLSFNPIQYNVLASAATDSNVVFYDTRTRSPIKTLVMRTKTNQIAWNPQEVYNFTLAMNDSNLYSFDMRKLKNALQVHEDHVNAVMSVAYAPTGREFVSGSYDCTVRIFNAKSGHSREVYHTQRMQRVFCTAWSADNKFVISGSDDTNVRIWKAQASKPMKTLLPREQAKLNYYDKLKKRYKHMPEIKRIARHKHLPKSIHKKKKQLEVQRKSARRKEQRRKKHTGAKYVAPEKLKAEHVRKVKD